METNGGGACSPSRQTLDEGTAVAYRPPYVPIYVHHVHGRLRMQLAELRGNQGANFAVRRKLFAISGVTAVSTNAVIGSVTVEYNHSALTPLEFTDALFRQGVDVRSSCSTVAAAPVAVTGGAASLRESVISAATQTLVEAVLQRAVRAIL